MGNTTCWDEASVKHRGRVENIDDKRVWVSISSGGDCGGCPAAKLCHTTGGSTNTIEIDVPNPHQYNIGDTVTVEGSERLHRKAIRLVTLYPTLAIIASMVGVFVVTGSETAAAVTGIAVMLIFFIALFLCRNRLAREFVFNISKE